ncbi:MAG: serine/threonine protein kinase [Myxococcales bacterium]|nr:serine/threonine protein kinase [Myxococcales bacterium]
MKGPLTQLGRYQLQEKIASGGMASIYKARLDAGEGYSKIVALKIMHPHLSEEAENVAMFLDEGRLTARLNHPNLIGTFDFGSLDGYRYLAMELHNGVSLAVLCASLKAAKLSIPPEIALFILREILSGLHYAHTLYDEHKTPLGIVHRDVSPENVLVTTYGEVKVIDFGIATARARSVQSEAGVVKGKVRYMSPEQAAGRKLDHRTDIYATALVGYEMLTGRPLFGTGTGDDYHRRIANAPDPALPPDADEHIPADVLPIFTRALRRRPQDRFTTAEEFRCAIDQVLTDRNWEPDREQLAALVSRAMPENAPQTTMTAAGRGRKTRAASHTENPTSSPNHSTYSNQSMGSTKARSDGLQAATAQSGNNDGLIWLAGFILVIFVVAVLLELFGVSFTVQG